MPKLGFCRPCEDLILAVLVVCLTVAIERGAGQIVETQLDIGSKDNLQRLERVQSQCVLIDWCFATDQVLDTIASLPLVEWVKCDKAVISLFVFECAIAPADANRSKILAIEALAKIADTHTGCDCFQTEFRLDVIIGVPLSCLEQQCLIGKSTRQHQHDTAVGPELTAYAPCKPVQTRSGEIPREKDQITRLQRGDIDSIAIVECVCLLAECFVARAVPAHYTDTLVCSRGLSLSLPSWDYQQVALALPAVPQ